MSDNKSNPLKKVFTLVTSPIWVPVAAVGGIVHGAVKGLDKANDLSKEEGALVGVGAAAPLTALGIVTGPFTGIKKVGETMWGDDDDK
ncbi:hypothetical protein MAR_030154 [Mya arenaria]|uniref:Uncharacterized protein n=1 Tax=Mya arenaria TaxID=6604 RepID=A0ABY7DJF1_MYAAR|nr:hypothetical protein MAR_030154 [Mya arenaria]